jgi:hypothetical protein
MGNSSARPRKRCSGHHRLLLVLAGVGPAFLAGSFHDPAPERQNHVSTMN